MNFHVFLALCRGDFFMNKVKVSHAQEQSFMHAFLSYLYKQGLLNQTELQSIKRDLEKGNNVVDLISTKSDVCN